MITHRIRHTPQESVLVRAREGRYVARAFGGSARERERELRLAQAMDRDSRDGTLHPAVRADALLALGRFFSERRPEGRNGDGR